MAKIKINNYTFDKVAKTVTFTDYTTIRLDGVLLITDVMPNVIIYNFADPTKGGTVLNNVLTLDYDTSGLLNTDSLLIYYDDASVIQKTQEQNPLNISTLANLTNQLDDATAQKQDDLKNLTSDIDALSRLTEDNLGTTDLLLKAMDKGERMPLQVQLPVDLKQDASGALIMSDMIGPIVWNSSTAGQPITIDCTGYDSVFIHKITTGVVTPSVSNDNKTFSATLAVAVSTGIPAATLLTAAGMYVIPVGGKYLQLVGPASAIQCFIYLSANPTSVNAQMLSAAIQNVTQYGSQPVVTANVNGMPAVGGNIAAGSAPTAYPVLIAGVDQNTTPLTRRILTDVSGRVQVGNISSLNNTAINTLGYNPTYRNILEVQDTTKTDDQQSSADLLSYILKELKVQSFILVELSKTLQSGGQVITSEADEIRRE